MLEYAECRPWGLPVAERNGKRARSGTGGGPRPAAIVSASERRVKRMDHSRAAPAVGVVRTGM